MGDYLPKFNPQAVTFTASAAVTGGRLVEVTGDLTVGPAGADSTKVVGVAGFDAAIGDSVTVYTPGPVERLTASAAVAAGARVASAADGKVATAGLAKYSVGIALMAAAADGDVIDVLRVDAVTPAA